VEGGRRLTYGLAECCAERAGIAEADVERALAFSYATRRVGRMLCYLSLLATIGAARS
jgi:hypothetical protein